METEQRYLMRGASSYIDVEVDSTRKGEKSYRPDAIRQCAHVTPRVVAVSGIGLGRGMAVHLLSTYPLSATEKCFWFLLMWDRVSSTTYSTLLLCTEGTPAIIPQLQCVLNLSVFLSRLSHRFCVKLTDSVPKLKVSRISKIRIFTHDL